MNQTPPTTEPASPVACAVDRSCSSDSGCGCNPTEQPAGQRRGLRAALVGAACVLGCLAVPLAIGGSAAIGGALVGEAWVIVAGITIAAVVTIAVKRRRGTVC
jgi:hypothetical protein